MTHKNNPEIDDYIAEYLSSWPDADADPAVQHRVAEEVARELRNIRRLSVKEEEEEIGLKIIFALVGLGFTGLLLVGVASPFGWDAFRDCLALLLPVPIKYAVIYTCLAVLVSLIILVQKMQKWEVFKNE